MSSFPASFDTPVSSQFFLLTSHPRLQNLYTLKEGSFLVPLPPRPLVLNLLTVTFRVKSGNYRVLSFSSRGTLPKSFLLETLVPPSERVWVRHFLDSCQLFLFSLLTTFLNLFYFFCTIPRARAHQTRRMATVPPPPFKRRLPRSPIRRLFQTVFCPKLFSDHANLKGPGGKTPVLPHLYDPPPHPFSFDRLRRTLPLSGRSSARCATYVFSDAMAPFFEEQTVILAEFTRSFTFICFSSNSQFQNSPSLSPAYHTFLHALAFFSFPVRFFPS